MIGSSKTACQAWKVMLVVIACLVAHGRPFYTNQAGEQTILMVGSLRVDSLKKRAGRGGVSAE
jgi:hypothetical protein